MTESGCAKASKSLAMLWATEICGLHEWHHGSEPWMFSPDSITPANRCPRRGLTGNSNVARSRTAKLSARNVHRRALSTLARHR